MKTLWNNALLAFCLTPLLALAALASGCAPYGYDWGWGVEVTGDSGAIFVEHDYHYIYPSTEMTIEIYWQGNHCSSDCPIAADLDLELRTASGQLVPYELPFADGCEHLGDDLGLAGYGAEAIQCQDPPLGHYEVRILNKSDEPQLVRLTTTVSQMDFAAGGADQYIEEIYVEPWGLATMPLALLP